LTSAFWTPIASSDTDSHNETMPKSAAESTRTSTRFSAKPNTLSATWSSAAMA
jgi:hypothetical protein